MKQPKECSWWVRWVYKAIWGIHNAFAYVTGAKSTTVVKEFHDEMEQVYAALATRIIELEASQRRLKIVVWTGVILSAAIWGGHLIGYLR
jgi:hypothetical protein